MHDSKRLATIPCRTSVEIREKRVCYNDAGLADILIGML